MSQLKRHTRLGCGYPVPGMVSFNQTITSL